MKKEITIIGLMMLLLVSSVSAARIDYTFENSNGLILDDVTLTDGYAYPSGGWGFQTTNLITTNTVNANVFYYKAYQNTMGNQWHWGVLANNVNPVENIHLSYSFMDEAGNAWNKFFVAEYDDSNQLTYFYEVPYTRQQIYAAGTCSDFKLVIDEVKGAKYYWKTSTCDDIITDNGWTLLYDSTPTGNNNGRTYSGGHKLNAAAYTGDQGHRLYYMGYDELCTPDWSCSSYDACNVNNVELCNSVEDLNTCGIPYSGNYSEFTQICVYNLAPIINSITPSSRVELKSGEIQIYTASITNNDDITYSWKLDNVEVGTSSTYTAMWDNIEPGIYTLTLTVDDGQYSDSMSKTLEIRKRGGDPTTPIIEEQQQTQEQTQTQNIQKENFFAKIGNFFKKLFGGK